MTLHRDLLEELRQVERDEFLANPRHYLLAERCFQLAIQCVMDVAYTLASFHQWQRPTDGRDALRLLGRQGVVPPAFADRIAPMANFRNILVHDYLGLDVDVIWHVLAVDLPPLRAALIRLSKLAPS